MNKEIKYMSYDVAVTMDDGMVIHVNLKTTCTAKSVAHIIDEAISKAVMKYNELTKDEQ